MARAAWRPPMMASSPIKSSGAECPECHTIRRDTYYYSCISIIIIIIVVVVIVFVAVVVVVVMECHT